MRGPSFKSYTVCLYWDKRAGYYVAEIPDIPTGANGRPAGEALAKLETTFTKTKKAYAAAKLSFPKPSASR